MTATPLERQEAAATEAQNRCEREGTPERFAKYYYEECGNAGSGKLPGGDTFETASEFRQHLITRDDQFTRCLTEKLLTYAIGRELEPGDRPVIDSILQDMQKRDRGLRDLVTLVVLSESFQIN